MMIAQGQLNIDYLCINIAELINLYIKSYLILLRENQIAFIDFFILHLRST